MQLDQLRTAFFSGTPVSLEASLEGQRVTGGRVVLGASAGGLTDVRHALHEMSHLVEIDDRRVSVRNWGLRYGTYRSFGRSHWYEFTTSDPIQRELRVGAFQYHLGAELGVYPSLDAFVINYSKTMTYMPLDTVCLLAQERGSHHEQVCSEVLRENIASGLYAYPKFEAEWWRKAKLLKRKVAE